MRRNNDSALGARRVLRAPLCGATYVLLVVGWAAAGLAHASVSSALLAAASSPNSFRSEDGELTGVLPCRPESVELPRPQPDGSSLISHRFKCNGTDFSVGAEYIDFPRSDVDSKTLLDGTRDGGIRGVKGQLVSEREIQVGGHPGRDLSAKAPGGKRFTWRLLVARDARRTRLIVLMYVGDEAGAAHPRIRSFLESVSIHSAPPVSASSSPKAVELQQEAQGLHAEIAQLEKDLAAQAPILLPGAIAAKRQVISRKRELREQLLAEAGRIERGSNQGQDASAGPTAVGSRAAGQESSPQGLESLFRRLRAAQLSGDTRVAIEITRALVPNEARLRTALKEDVPAEAVQRILDLHRQLIPSKEADLVGLLGADPANTEVRVHAATTEQLAAYAEGSVAYREFPGGAQSLARTLLRPKTTFFEVELVRPGQESGMTYHLFFWDGERWAMLGPMWRTLR